MKGLLLRLSALDADAATAVRVIAHFEALMSAGSDAVSLVRSTAGLAQCAAGLERTGGRRVRFGPGGAALPGEPERVSGSAFFGDTDSGPGGRVWLERPGAPGPFDELVLEWMAIAARMLDGRRRAAEPPHAADPALVELVLSEREAVEDRARALRLLGLVPELPLRVVAVALAGTGAAGAPASPGSPGAAGSAGGTRGADALTPAADRGNGAGGAEAASAGSGHGAGPAPDIGVETVALLGRSGLPGSVRIARVGPLGAVLVQRPDGDPASPAEELRAAAGARPAGPDAPGQPAGRAVRSVRAGVGGLADALDAGVSWQQARVALRFAVAGPPEEAVTDHDDLGPVALLAEVPAERLRARPEVRALAELAAGEGGGTGIAALAAFCRTGSLRQAAAELHLHHSSVAARLAHVEETLGWRLRDPRDRFRAHLALYAWRLSGTE
ncbi:helix-turn-helix domain-containing protein [Streptomyces sp. S07_1.15]|uniref:helix-turn-helix domain-containing protein n=1 Tax=Streptomyces sp. S07_1.15 TaxID=2873925 RepID=UPI001D15055F|nr:helix-turn-helix domain-containing protein [Streptomyces sp. S07_1.15]MCC3654483.1 helix-turn-helix domain-containing protein [Streptomyces sp. S07_1.15]